MGELTEIKVIRESAKYRLVHLWDNDYGWSGAWVNKFQKYHKGLFGLGKGWYTTDKWATGYGGWDTKTAFYVEKYFGDQKEREDARISRPIKVI